MLAPLGEMLCYCRCSQTKVLGNRVHDREGGTFAIPWATTWKIQARMAYVLKMPGRPQTDSPRYSHSIHPKLCMTTGV